MTQTAISPNLTNNSPLPIANSATMSKPEPCYSPSIAIVGKACTHQRNSGDMYNMPPSAMATGQLAPSPGLPFSSPSRPSTSPRTPHAVNSAGGPRFQPVIYALDILPPILDLGQGKSYTATGMGHWITWLIMLIGWVLATAVIAGVTRILTRT